MPKGDKTPMSYDKTAIYYINKGDKEWAKASSDPNQAYRYQYARNYYETTEQVLKTKVKKYGLPQDQNTISELKKLIKKAKSM